MSDFGEAIGTAVTGGLAASAIESERGASGSPPISKGYFAENSCLNCGTGLTGNHCHECGQKAHLHRTLGAFGHDLLHGALHLDGKTWRTLPLLVTKPGQLTRRYIDGERARFVSPMALFLFTIFLMFAVFQIAGISAPTDLQGDKTKVVATELTREVGEMEERLATLDERLETATLTPDQRSELEQERLETAENVAALREVSSSVPFLPDLSEPDDEAGNRAVASAPAAEADENQSRVPFTTGTGQEGSVDFGGLDWIEGGLEKWRENPGLMLYKLQANFYKFSWLIIPLSVPFVWLLFAWKRRFKAYDHAIFVTYSLSFMTLLTLALVLAGLAGVPTPIIVFSTLLIPPIHIYKQLRGTYGLSRFSAVWRLFILSIFIVVVLSLFLQLLLLVGLF